MLGQSVVYAQTNIHQEQYKKTHNKVVPTIRAPENIERVRQVVVRWGLFRFEYRNESKFNLTIKNLPKRHKSVFVL